MAADIRQDDIQVGEPVPDGGGGAVLCQNFSAAVLRNRKSDEGDGAGTILGVDGRGAAMLRGDIPNECKPEPVAAGGAGGRIIGVIGLKHPGKPFFFNTAAAVGYSDQDMIRVPL